MDMMENSKEFTHISTATTITNFFYLHRIYDTPKINFSKLTYTDVRSSCNFAPAKAEFEIILLSILTKIVTIQPLQNSHRGQ